MLPRAAQPLRRPSIEEPPPHDPPTPARRRHRHRGARRVPPRRQRRRRATRRLPDPGCRPRSPLRHGVDAGGPGPAARQDHRDPLRGGPGGRSQQAARPGVRPRGRPRPGRHPHRAADAGGSERGERAARHRVHRPARHRRLAPARVQGGGNVDQRHVRAVAADRAARRLPEGTPRRSPAIRHLDRGPGLRRRAGAPGRRAGQPLGRLVRNARRARVHAAVPAARAQHGARRRRTARHGAAGVLRARRRRRAVGARRCVRARRTLPSALPRDDETHRRTCSRGPTSASTCACRIR